MNEPSDAPSERLRRHLQRLHAGLKRALPFVAGMLAMLGALLLHDLLAPAPRPLTTRDVKDTVAQALASATPPPAWSVLAYQAVQPALVLVEVKVPGADGKQENGLGTGVIIDDRGDILTSLHVVANADEIQLTFADGTQSSAEVAVRQPENDIAVLQASQPPAQLAPATLGNPNAMRVGDEAYVVGNPFGLYGSMSAGIVSGFGRSFSRPMALGNFRA